MGYDRWQLVAHVLMAVGGIVAVVLLTSWHDIPGSTALVVIMGLTGTSGAHAVAAGSTPNTIAQTLAEEAGGAAVTTRR